jgi:glycosyltransferase involved in cell wall biosynthesis
VFALIPARNEGPRVGEVVRAASAHVEGVLVVVNGCIDDTAEQARAAGAEVMESDAGYAQALKAGYRHLQGSAVVQLDADGQHPAEAIPLLREGLREADLVIGSRFLEPSGYRMSLRRRVAIEGLSWLTMALIGQRIRDVTSGFQALSPRAVGVFAECFPEDYADANIFVLARRNDLLIREVPVNMRPRSGGASMHDRGALRYLGGMTARTLREGLR